MINETYLTVPECAIQLRKSPKTIRRWIRAGYRGIFLAASRAGWDYRVSPKTLENFLWQTSKEGGINHG